MVFGSTLLEVAIGVIFVYLLLSLLCSALSELIESFIRFRARDLERGIGKLLKDPGLAEEFFNHPLVEPLGERPSYIPARTFSLALWSLATTKATEGKEAAAWITQDLNAIRNLLTSLDDKKYGSIKMSLLTLIDEAGNDINRARANIEGWYNDAMDRVSGWYKRRTHWMLVVMGLLAASFLNVDTINVTQALWYNDTLRNSVVTSAENYITTNPAPAAQPAAAPQDGAAAASAEEQAKVTREKINTIRDQINRLGLPIGWVYEPVKGDEKYKDNQELYDKDMAAYRVDPRRFPGSGDGYAWFLKVLGIFLTALAVSQGAPFWFDVLNKFIVVRSTVKPREKSSDQPSKDKPAPETTKTQPVDKEPGEGNDKG